MFDISLGDNIHKQKIESNNNNDKEQKKNKQAGKKFKKHTENQREKCTIHQVYK